MTISAQKPLKLEFNYELLPNPPGSSNKVTLHVVAAGDMLPLFTKDFALTVGADVDLDTNFATLAGFLKERAEEKTKAPLSDEVYFTDKQGQQKAFKPLPQPGF